MDVRGDSHCFVCGWANPASLGVTFLPDAAGGSRAVYVARNEHDGWPGVLHGGVLFAVLDDAIGWAARYSGEPCVTARAEIRYRKTVTTQTTLLITGRVRAQGRVLMGEAQAVRQDTGEVVADMTATLFRRTNR